jgi:aminomethyltransferase
MPTLPLHDLHLTYGAKMVFYGGFTVPQEFIGLVKEHHVVRNHAGLFDVSHMGRVFIRGKDSYAFVERLITNRLPSFSDRKAVYGLVLNEQGYPLDDLIAYPLSNHSILLVINAINAVIDLEWMKRIQQTESFDVEIEVVTLTMGQLALQGPLAEMALQSVITKKVELNQLTFMKFIETQHQGQWLMISRSGYTGSDGFEIYADVTTLGKLWQALLAIPDVKPCGLGARDTLRFEAALPLYSHELSETISPLETGVTFAIKWEQDFIGKTALESLKNQPLKRKLVGIELLDRGVVRAEYPVLKDGKVIGHITTGYLLPGHEKGLAMALLDAPHFELGTHVTVMMRTTPLQAVVRDMIFMTKQYKR